MIQGLGKITQALLGTLFTWGLTAIGSAMVIFMRGEHKKSLDISLGFAAGVMIAASFWSLLSPAIELAKYSGKYGEQGEFAFLPVAGGFLFGAAFVYATDKIISHYGFNNTAMIIALSSGSNKEEIDPDDLEYAGNSKRRGSINSRKLESKESSLDETATMDIQPFSESLNSEPKKVERKRKLSTPSIQSATYVFNKEQKDLEAQLAQWKRIMLLVVAIVVHNIPEGLAVGVSFGAVGNSESATFEAARNLAIGIGIQNFPEGLAVSLPLHAAGFSLFRSFWYGQLSGMVEPIFGVLGALAVGMSSLILPYALAFAAGAMIYIVADDILPEAHSSGNGSLATLGCIIGFVIMMCLDVGLG